eukprot:403335602
MVTGINEDQVKFTAIQQNGDILYEGQGKRENDVSIKSKDNSKINLCWQKLDRKSKKLTFNFKVTNIDSNVKANTETLSLLQTTIEKMQTKLDQISRNVYMQSEVDKEHSDLTQSTTSSQTWMSIFKMLLVVGICFGQFYFITQFFNSKSTKQGGGRETNPFGRSII